MVIFHRYVELPEAKPPFSHGFLWFSMDFLWISYGFPTDFSTVAGGLRDAGPDRRDWAKARRCAVEKDGPMAAASPWCWKMSPGRFYPKNGPKGGTHIYI